MEALHQQTKILLSLIKESGGMYQRPRIDYFEFRNRWLPLFNYSSNQGMAPLGEWIQQVCWGNAFMEVDVIKGGEKVPDSLHEGSWTIQGGKYMFTVPATLNRNIEVKLDSGKSIDNVIITAQRKREFVAAAGENHMQKEIVNGIQINVPVDPGLFEAMNKIFEHFGVKRSLPDGSKNKDTPIHTTEDKPEEKIDNDLLDFSF